MAKMIKPYKAECTARGSCVHERQWAIVARFPGQDDAELMGQTFGGSEGQELARAIADELNEAYELGFISGATR